MKEYSLLPVKQDAKMKGRKDAAKMKGRKDAAKMKGCKEETDNHIV